MATFLALAQKLNQNSVDSGSGPTTVTGQSGELKRMVDWIADAWTELQNEEDEWRWMRKGFTVNTVASDGGYSYGDCTDTATLAVITRFSRWYKDSFKAYLQSSGVGGEFELQWVPWEQFRRIYRYGTQTDSTPIHVSVNPLQNFVLGPIPNAVFVVSGDYQIGPQILAADGDIPEMPTRFHNLIVYEAMMKYGGFRSAPDAMIRATTEGPVLKSALRRDQLPQITLGRSLA